MQFQIFGSKNSLDYDIMVFVDKIPNIIDDAHTVCKSYNNQLSNIYRDKVLNCNLAVLDNGRVIDVFKGTVDEVNNSLFYTYENHKQEHELLIKSVVDRDVEQKILRVCRCILSFYSRTELRSIVKPALRGDLRVKIPVLKQIDFTSDIKFEKKETTVDIYKVIAFQFGQLFSLLDGFESDSYTKDGIVKHYPKLYNMINRKELTVDVTVMF